MGEVKSKCLDCAAMCLGTRCLACYKKRRTAEAASAVRTCAVGGCDSPLVRRNRSGVCLAHLRSGGHLKLDAPKRPTAKTRPPPEELNVEQSADVLTISALHPKIQTVAQALEAAEVDTNVWAIERKKVSAYQSPNLEGSRQMVAVQVWLRRRIAENIAASLAQLVKDSGLPRAPKRPRPRRLACDYLAEFSPYDHHFGKLAWGKETGEDYDLKIATSRFLHATEDAVARVKPWDIGRWVCPVGNDFFHYDTPAQTTTAGTPMDVDGRWQKAYTVGARTLLAALGMLLEVAPVHVVWVEGNHDRMASMWLCMVIAEHFHADARVSVDLSPSPRKYVEFGSNLIGYTHGDEVRVQDLPTIMATEKPQAWAATTHREWHLGHMHKKKQTRWTDVDTHAGVVCRWLPSMCGTDSWHYKKGYMGSARCAEVYIWGHKEGYLGHLAVGA